MLKWAFIFAAIAIVAGVLGFVVDVAGAVAKFLFFVFAVGAVVSFISHAARKRAGTR
jgi:uncharacterized membrane protein YtjA (UPF0391 family)